MQARYRQLFWVGLLLFLPRCACDIVWSPPGAGECDPAKQNVEQHPDWLLFRKASKDDGASACLQIAWGQQAPSSVKNIPVRLKEDQIFAKHPTSDEWNASPFAEIPASASGQRFRLRLLVIHPAFSGDKEQLCLTSMANVQYDCLRQKSNRECLFFYEFRPNQDGNIANTFHIDDADPSRTCKFFLDPNATFPPESPPETSPVEPSQEPPVEPVPDENPPRERPSEPSRPDGSERPVVPEEPQCRPDQVRVCYTGPANTEGIGQCRAGSQLCLANGTWALECTGERLPAPESCDGLDNDCDGLIDNSCWVGAAGGFGEDRAYGIVTDVNGIPYATGFVTEGNISFGPQTVAAVRRDIFVAQLDAVTGRWTRVVVPASSKQAPGDEESWSIAYSKNENALYITGYYSSPVPFGGTPNLLLNAPAGTPVGTILPSDAFVAKLDLNLNWQWVTRIGGAGFDVGSHIATNSKGELFVVGVLQADPNNTNATARNFDYPTPTGDVTGSIDANHNRTFFLGKLDASGKWQWVVPVVEQTTSVTELQKLPLFLNSPRIAIDQNDNIYVTGSFVGTSVKLGTSSTGALGLKDLFLCRFDSNGKQLGCLVAQGSKGTELISVHGITTNQRGQLYLGGSFLGEVSFGATKLTSQGGTTDMFWALADVNASSWLRAQKEGGSQSEAIHSIAVDARDQVYIAGQFQKETTIGSFPIPAITGLDTRIFIAKLDANKQWVWALGFGGGNPGVDGGDALFASPLGDIFLAGTISTNNFESRPLFPSNPPAPPHLLVGKNLHQFFNRP